MRPDLHLPFAHPFPAFNVADSCIFIAVCRFIAHSLKKRKEPVSAQLDRAWRPGSRNGKGFYHTLNSALGN
jgi:hypothetical protein